MPPGGNQLPAENSVSSGGYRNLKYSTPEKTRPGVQSLTIVDPLPGADLLHCENTANYPVVVFVRIPWGCERLHRWSCGNDCFVRAQNRGIVSFPRRRESTLGHWIPACAGMTTPKSRCDKAPGPPFRGVYCGEPALAGSPLQNSQPHRA